MEWKCQFSFQFQFQFQFQFTSMHKRINLFHFAKCELPLESQALHCVVFDFDASMQSKCEKIFNFPAILGFCDSWSILKISAIFLGLFHFLFNVIENFDQNWTKFWVKLNWEDLVKKKSFNFCWISILHLTLRTERRLIFSWRIFPKIKHFFQKNVCSIFFAAKLYFPSSKKCPLHLKSFSVALDHSFVQSSDCSLSLTQAKNARCIYIYVHCALCQDVH